MDTITHGLAGWLLARTIPVDNRPKEATIALVVGAVLPDADNIASLFGSEVYLRVHRGLSHGFAGVAVTSVLVALLLYRYGRWKDWKRLYILTLLGQLSHIGLDLLNSYGTQIFQPFSDARVAFDILFIVDLAFTGIIVAGLLLSRTRPGPARASLAALFLYTVAALALHLRAEGIVRDAAVGHGVHVVASSALPQLGRIPEALVPEWDRKAEAAGDARYESTLSHGGTAGSPRTYPLPAGPFAWNGFVDDGTTYIRAEVDPILGTLSWRERVVKGDLVPEVQPLRGIPDVRTYLWFARFPAARVDTGTGGTTVSFFDLRFGAVPGRRPFLLTVTEKTGLPPQVRWGSR